MSGDLPARRELAAAGHRLVAAGFQRITLPGIPGTWIYQHRRGLTRIRVILRADRGHQIVSRTEWDGTQWVIRSYDGYDAEQQPYTITTATDTGIRLATGERSAA
ncbi:hypothetical protein [Kutzneria albida]|uniref:Uncharacterized protein n=1 Tax=Kutzneria albida DSM 43870 TaxID=1449976 RepID=W5WBL3_9PSEU|nr:hypothetical protein [Kutzneria albida]AHH98257.1 hypothetical protein KALB_4895 [Kutzneria albida DSM 43870]